MHGDCREILSGKLLKVDSRLLNLVLVDVEAAAELFETMEKDLRKHIIEVKDAADTTNVILGAVTALLLASCLPTLITWQTNVLAILVL